MGAPTEQPSASRGTIRTKVTVRQLNARVEELQAELASVRANEETYRAVFEQSPLSMVIAKLGIPSGVTNAAYCQFWNLNSHDLATREASAGNHFHESDFLPHLERFAAGHPVVLGPYLSDAGRIASHGKKRWVTAVGYPLRDPAGRVTDVVIVHQAADPTTRLERVENGRASVLARTLEALANEPSLDSFITHVLAVLVERLPAESASLWLVEPATGDADRLYHANHLGLQDGPAMSKLANIPSRVKSENLQDLDRSNVVRHYKHDLAVLPRYQPFKKAGDARGIQSTAFVPLLNRGVFRGWIVLTFQTAGSLPPEDEPFAAALANQAVFALEITRVAKEASQAAVWRERDDAAEKRAAALADANGFLRDAAADLHTLEHLDIFLLKILAAADRILEAEYTALFLMGKNGDGVNMSHLVRDGVPLDITGQPGTGTWLAAAQADSSDYMGIWSKPDRTAGHWWLSVDDTQPLRASRAWLKGTGNASIAHFPLWWGQDLLGFIAVVFSASERPSDVKLETVQVLAQQISMAREVARLGAESRQAALVREREAVAHASARELARANAALAQSTAELSVKGDLNTYLTRLLHILLELMECQSVSLWLMQPGGTPQPALQVDDGSTTPFSISEKVGHDGVSFLRDRVFSAGSGAHGHDGTGWPPQVHPDVATSSLFDGAEDIRACFLSGGVRATMIVPVLAGNRHLGSFVVCASVARTWTAEQIELAQSLGNQAALAIEVKRLNDDTRKAAVEGERNRFARDIHDTLAQDFTAIAAHLRSARRKLTATRLRPADIASITAALDVAFETAQDGLLQARRSVWALTPRALEDGVSLANAIRKVIGRMPAGRVEVTERGTPQSLPAGVALELLSIAREAANNALRHAGPAARVIVSVSHEQQGVRLNIDDDGCGFNPSPAGGQQQGHFGLWTMRERASRIGGHFHLVSRPDCGTEITVFVPLDSER